MSNSIKSFGIVGNVYSDIKASIKEIGDGVKEMDMCCSS